MTSGTYIFMGVIVFIILGLIFFLADWTEKQNAPQTNSTENLKACRDLGCPEGTEYVASASTKLYFPCTCSAAKEIKQIDIVCFETKRQAILDNYYKGYC